MPRVGDVNSVPATVGQAAFATFQSLKLAGWVTKAASDGLTFNPTGEQITHPGSGAGGFGNSLAWRLMEDPSGRRQVCYQRGTSDTLSSGSHARIKVSEAAKFVGGSPSATRVPAASDEQILVGTGTDAAPSPINLWANSAQRLHMVADPTPIGGVYGFWMFQTALGSANQTGGSFFCEPMAPGTYRAGDVAPCNWYASSTGFSGGQTVSGWFAYGLPNQAWSTVITANYGPYNGAIGVNLVDNTHDNGHPTWYANVGGSNRIRGIGAGLAGKGPALAYPATANSPTNGYAYLGSVVWPYLNGVAPSVS